MTNKYIDLYPEIVGMRTPAAERDGVATALEWLDAHPDQVPGRTITVSEFNAAVAMHESNRLTHAEQVALILQRFGITVALEPSNAEKLEALLREVEEAPMSVTNRARWLEAQGVKALGGDDE